MTLKGTPSAHARMYRILSTSAVVQEQNRDHVMKAPAERLGLSVVLGALTPFKTRAPEVHDQQSRRSPALTADPERIHPRTPGINPVPPKSIDSKSGSMVWFG